MLPRVFSGLQSVHECKRTNKHKTKPKQTTRRTTHDTNIAFCVGDWWRLALSTCALRAGDNLLVTEPNTAIASEVVLLRRTSANAHFVHARQGSFSYWQSFFWRTRWLTCVVACLCGWHKAREGHEKKNNHHHTHWQQVNGLSGRLWTTF